jgi:hypothetical protein
VRQRNAGDALASNLLRVPSLSEVIHLGRLFFAIMAVNIVLLFAVGAYIISPLPTIGADKYTHRFAPVSSEVVSSFRQVTLAPAT